MTFKEYRTKHCPAHYNLCWIVGEEKPVSKMIQYFFTKLKFTLYLNYYLGFEKL